MADSTFSCLFCKKEKLGTQKCGGCKAVHYCSKDCQRKDWPVHKASCTYKKKTGAGDRCFTGGAGNAKAKTKTINSDFTKALKAAKALFPGRRVETKFDNNIPNDHVLEMMRMMNASSLFKNVLVVQIVTRIVEVLLRVNKHVFVVMDENGLTAPMFFDIENNEPRPYFTWDEFKPGTFICIVDASFHNFPEDQKGFKICDAREILLLNKLE